jgi:hypothetical protein
MQPVCGIPGERIESAVKQLDELAAGASETIWLYPISLLSRLAFDDSDFSIVKTG